MSEPAAIDGDYANFALVKTRGVCQIVVEFPIEHAEKVTRLLGFPHHGKIKRVAVALLNDTGPKPSLTPGPAEGGAATTGANAAPPSPKPNSTRAVMMAKDPECWHFLTAKGYIVASEDVARLALKDYLGIASLKQLNDPGLHAAKFLDLRREFYEWRRQNPGGPPQ